LHEDYAVDTYLVLDRARAFENQVWLVTSNVVGSCGDEEYFGQARIVSPEGRVIAETPGLEEGIVSVTVDARAGLVKARAHNLLVGLDMLRHRRPETYRRLCS
jgi:predicted amidohydrolase